MKNRKIDLLAFLLIGLFLAGLYLSVNYYMLEIGFAVVILTFNVALYYRLESKVVAHLAKHRCSCNGKIHTQTGGKSK